ncbi:MAG TPA: efflux RND transporter permease subunit [Longimicrobiales bacterium]|nr:efflux RND transporter permease subunit [Longimicrobiales bacterium]
MIRLSIRRPVAVAMTYAAVSFLGIRAWTGIPIELLPDTRLPRLTLTGTWRGASPETVEAFLTSPLESAIQQVQGVEKIVSESYEENGTGTANVQVEFQRGTDMEFARLDLSERIAALEDELPAGADRVVVEQYVPEEFQEQSGPFLRYTFTGPYTLEALRRHVDDIVVPALSQAEGVGVVRVFGGRERRLEVSLDEQKVAALGLDAGTVRRRIQELDLVREAGVVREGDQERTITIVNRPGSAEDVRNAVISSAGGTPVRVSDIATVHDTYEEARSFNRIDGRPAVTFVVTKQIGANTVRVADAVKERLTAVERLSPFGARFILDYDESEDIREQLTDLRTRALFSLGVIFVVLLLFLGSFRSAALLFTTIGFSVLIALNFVYFGGISLNLLTLMGLAMGFGLVVDNAIVVLENTYRRWQGGEAPGRAAEEGAREVVMAVLASAATTLIVFVPFVYLQGELRVFYVPLALVVVLTQVASLFVSFTFIPALAARALRAGGGWRTRAALGAPPRRPLYARFYSDVVGFNLRHPWTAIFVTGAIFGGSYFLFHRYVTTWTVFGGGFGERTYISVYVTLPRGSDLDRTDQLVVFFEDKLSELPEVEQVTATVYEDRAYMEITFPDSLENTQVPVAIKEQMFAYSHSFTGAEVRVYGYGPSFYGGGSSPPNYAISVLGYNYERVRDIAEDIGTRLTRLPRIQEVDTNASSRRFTRDKASEYVVTIDRDRLARHAMSVEGLVSRLAAAVGGNARLGYLKLGGEEVQYQVKLEADEDMDVLALTETLVDTPGGERIRLGEVVTVAPREILARIRRENQQYERTVAYEFRGPQKLGDLFHERVIAATQVPPGYTVEKGDTGWWIDTEEQQQIWLVIAVSLVLIYMVTAATFESLVQPLCVILTVPMALIGVFLIFYYTGAAFTREAYIGVIMMFGIVVNNAILLVDHVNGVRRREPGLGFDEAVVKGTLERVRPILMTTVTTVLGLVPLVVFGEGAGSRIWDALALVLMGGLLSSTLFVLTLTPAVYGLMERPRLTREAAPKPVPSPQPA